MLPLVPHVNLRSAWRMVCRNPAVAAIVTATIGLAISLNCALFSVLDSLLLKDLPVNHPSELGEVLLGRGEIVPYNLWQQLREVQDVFRAISAWSITRVNIARSGEAQYVTSAMVSESFFETLGVRPQLGRLFSMQDGSQNAAAIVIITDAFWKRRYNRDRRAIGNVLFLEKHAFEIVGITPPGFVGIEIGQPVDLFVPISKEGFLHKAKPLISCSYCYWIQVVGRVKAGLTVMQANTRLAGLSRSILERAVPKNLPERYRDEYFHQTFSIAPAARGVSQIREYYGSALIFLDCCAVLVLLIACANVANILLGRLEARRAEFAMKIALGARKADIISQLLIESLLLSLPGALGGCVLGLSAAHLLPHFISSTAMPVSLPVRADGHIMLFAAVFTVLTAVLFGIFPALGACRGAPGQALKERRRGLSFRRTRFTKTHLIFQVSMSVLLLSTAAMLVHSLRKLTADDPGFNPNDLLLIRIEPGVLVEKRLSALWENVLNRIESLPDVQSASRFRVTPITGASYRVDIRIDGRLEHAYQNYISPQYFRTFSTPLIAGRSFTPSDNSSSALVAIINETAARRLFSGLDAIGRAFVDLERLDEHQDAIVRVIGVAKDSKYDRLDGPVPPTIYEPLLQEGPSARGTQISTGTFAVRYSGPLHPVISKTKEMIAALDESASFQFELFTDQIRDSLLQEHLLSALTSAFALIATVLTAIGLYGALTQSLAHRGTEIGIRLALGAQYRSILWLAFRETLVILLIAQPIGVALFFLCTRFARSVIPGLSGSESLMTIGVCTFLLFLSAIASLLPAHRAARLDPLRELREE